MATRDMFTLDTPIAPKMVRILYGIAFVLIVLGTLVGVGRGIARMTHEPRTALMDQRANQQPPNPSPDTPPSAQAPAPQNGMAADGMRMRMRGMMGYGMPGPRMRGRGMGMHHGGRFGHRGGPGLLGRQPPAVMGAIQILRALVMGAIGLLVVRILAEVALSLLAMLRRAAATA